MEPTFIARFADAWRQPSPERLVALLHRNVVLHQPYAPAIHGKDAARREFQRLLRWLPGLCGEVRRACDALSVRAALTVAELSMLLIKNLLFTLLVPGTVAVYIPLWIAGVPAAALPPAWHAARLAAVLALLLGSATYLWCVWQFAVTGRGTPAPIDAPNRLVVQGLYRYVRNPMYLGVVLVIGGWALYFWSAALAIYGVGVWFVVHGFVVLFEEPRLEQHFGAAYRRYRHAVGRWMPWPR